MSFLSCSVFGLIFLLPFICFGKIDTSALYRIYDDGETKVESPRVDFVWTTSGDRLEIGAGFTQDHVTSSSADVRSFSSVPTISDVRNEASTVLSWQMDEGKVGTSFIHSQENDYISTALGFAGTREFFDKNTTFFSSFAYGEDKFSTAKDRENYKLMSHESYSLSLTQVLSQVSVAQLLLDYRMESGYLSSPYRQARKFNSNGSGRIIGLPENLPLTRNRTALTAKFNYFLSGINISTSSSLRTYLDSWGVKSFTFEERVGKNLGPHFEISANARIYTQTKASFYEDVYTEIGPFYTGNKTLSNMNSMLFGVSPAVSLGGIKLYCKYEYYKANHADFTDVGHLSDTTDNKLLVITANIFSVGLLGEF